MIRPTYILGLLLTLAFSLATYLQPVTRNWRTRSTEGGLMGMLFGDGRRMFANHFTAKADQYFHSGYYPSIFDQRSQPKEGAEEGHVHDENCKHGEETTSPGHVHDDTCAHAHDPKGACASGCNHTQHGDHSVEQCEEKSGKWDLADHDWVATIGRNFRVTEHTHLEGGKSRELLPWLKISAELDPHQINTYLMGSYWLRKGEKSAEAEKFIRDGLEANPQNCELIFELGQIYLIDRKNPDRAKNLIELALNRWDVQERTKEKPDLILLANIASHLARIEEAKGLIPAAIEHLERARQASPQSEALGKQIEELKSQLKAAPKAATTSAH
jgi:hypothetical protein